MDFNSIRGGNLLSLPGGACLTSINAPSFFPESVCGKQSPLVRIDTQKTRVGHIDELVNILPNSKNAELCLFVRYFYDKSIFLKTGPAL